MADSADSPTQMQQLNFTDVFGVNAVEHQAADNAAHIESLAEQASLVVERYLSLDRQAKSDVQTVVRALLACHAEMSEWNTLHYRLHQVLVACAPFTMQLSSRQDTGGESAGEDFGWLQNWHLCQDALDDLGQFAEAAKMIGEPFLQRDNTLSGERWAVEPIALRGQLEDVLREETPNQEAVRELAQELISACYHHLLVADLRLREALERSERLVMCLLGGIL